MGHRGTEDVKVKDQINFAIHLKLFIFVYALKMFWIFGVYFCVFVLLLNFMKIDFLFVFVLCKLYTHPHIYKDGDASIVITFSK